MTFTAYKLLRALSICLLAVVIFACSQPQGDVTDETAVIPATATSETAVIPVPTEPSDPNFIVIATDAPNPPFTAINNFGEVTGFSALTLDEIMASASLTYELVVTPNEGVLDTIAAGSNKDFDAVMTNLIIPEVMPEGIQYTAPYLEVGQVVVVLVDNRTLDSYQNLSATDRVGVVQNSWGELAVSDLLPNVPVNSSYENEVQALQSLIDEQLTAVVIDSSSAEYFTAQYPDQIKIIGGDGQSAWIQQRGYGLAVASDNQELLAVLNDAILSLQSGGAFQRNFATLIPADTLVPGEPRAGTSEDELVIGMIGNINSLDPSGSPSLIDWEIKSNVMSGLYRITNGNEIEPLLASGLPTVSDDGLEYTVRLRQGILFPDGTELKAEDVKWSVDRARSLGNFLINDYLKDVDGNNFADDDAVQVVGEYSVKFVLEEPLGYFTSILATPPYFPISNECFAINGENQSTCGGIGPYLITNWEFGEQIELEANPDWPGRPDPVFDNIVVRFFEDSDSITRSLQQFQSIDMIWTGMPYFEMQALADSAEADGELELRLWEGTPIFKSYLIFDHDTAPWDKRRVRLAAAYALDRDALAALFGGNREALFSPIPSSVPGHTAVFPIRNLPQARIFLAEEGYSQTNPLEIDLWYVSDGRYSTIEASYANEIKRQLEETGIFQVTINGADFEQFRQQISVCNYPAYLIGWPSPGRPSNYLDVTSWTDFFVQNTSGGFCSNYESPTMDTLVESALEQEGETRLNTYVQIQQQWAQDIPTLDLLEENRFAISLSSIGNVTIDAMGLMHYELLTKQ